MIFKAVFSFGTGFCALASNAKESEVNGCGWRIAKHYMLHNVISTAMANGQRLLYLIRKGSHNTRNLGIEKERHGIALSFASALKGKNTPAHPQGV